jgi:hypothetical protein
VAFLKVYGGTEWHHTFGLTARTLKLQRQTDNPHWDGKPTPKYSEFWMD